MSNNYYLVTPEMPDGTEGVHLGQSAAGGFTFRADPDRAMNYEAWLTRLDTGEIRDESGAPVSRDEMVEIASAPGRKAPRSQRGTTFAGGTGFYDMDGRRWLTVEFC